MASLFILFCVGCLIGLLLLAGRKFSQSEAAELLGESYLLAAGGSGRNRHQK
jgi:hypothetical protein